jgi:hypothetical protein
MNWPINKIVIVGHGEVVISRNEIVTSSPEGIETEIVGTNLHVKSKGSISSSGTNIRMGNISFVGSSGISISGSEVSLGGMREVTIDGNKYDLITVHGKQLYWPRGYELREESPSKRLAREESPAVQRSFSLSNLVLNVHQVELNGQVSVSVQRDAAAAHFGAQLHVSASGQSSFRFARDSIANLTVVTSGQSHAEIDGTCSRAVLRSSGQSSITMKLVTEDLEAGASGQSSIHATASRSCSVDRTQGGQADLRVVRL